ncbi:MAG TPA: prepilin-type N-terminal cleavage/methylation domain-containing protein [Burkholderiales bacterium]|nr:prepilin-type N-terminal cleavage/methylation domain-containing protein [Burkholderiales bacterium]
MNRPSTGFTLVELIVVIVTLGILAATALPQFVNLQGNARAATVNAFAGGLQSAVNLVQSGWVAQGNVSPVTLANGNSVTVSATGIPTANLAGIGTAMNCQSATLCQGMVANFGPLLTTFQPNGGPLTGLCQVSYTAAGVINATVSGC